ncbi:hypothetical protein PMAYCL1PPCAC_12543, partial [Pristionchus mayeri]
SMPFIAVSFSNHDHSNVLHEKAQSVLSHSDGEVSLISRLLCIHPPSQTHKRVYSIFQWLQRIYLFLLILLLISAIFLLFHQASIFLLIYISSLIDFVLLLWWNESSVHERFPQCLLEATSGVGSVKRRESIETTQRLTFTILFVLSLLYILLFVLSSIFRSSSSPPPLLHPYIGMTLLTISLSVVLFSTVAASTLFITRLSLLSSEFHTHSDDFLTDSNTFQACVLKHYCLIHTKIINAFSTVRRSFSLWLFLHILLDFVHFHLFLDNLLRLFNSSSSLPSDPVQSLLFVSRDLLLPLFIPLTRFIFSFASIYRLQMASKRFTHHLASLLCTQNKMMNDQTYFICMTYSSHLSSSCNHHLRLFGLILNSSFLFKISLSSLILLYLIHVRDI